MDKKEFVARLDKAISEIYLAEMQLNEDAHQCDSCGLLKRHDFGEHQTRVSLRAIRMKLERYMKWGDKK
jgi:hypothetical protein